MEDPARAKAVLGRLDVMGIRLAVDDFGTGYSSLAYLRQLPLTEIKIDKSFVTTMDASSDDEVIVRSIIDLGRNLGLEVVAEGVETADVLSRLASLGCGLAQGYLISRPMPADEFAPWLGRSPYAANADVAAA
jgi:EAL domain-containing protein (putative c-di-GMP-specific phosphodiesterase class I)